MMGDGFGIWDSVWDRNAIEEELEVLYDAYYEELEQYANHQQQFLVSGGKITPPPGPGPFPGSVALDSNGAVVTGRQHAKHTHNARMNGNGKGAGVEYDEEEYDDEEEEYEEDEDPEEDEGSDEDGSEPPLSKAPTHRRGRGGTGETNGRGPPRRGVGRDDFLNFGSLTAAGTTLPRSQQELKHVLT
jgi:Salt tolerance down-regulator